MFVLFSGSAGFWFVFTVLAALSYWLSRPRPARVIVTFPDVKRYGWSARWNHYTDAVKEEIK